jgi:hypothetical protein
VGEGERGIGREKIKEINEEKKRKRKGEKEK